MDILSWSNGFELNEVFGSMVDGKWVQDNVYKYGFIICYLKNKEDIMKYEYELWYLCYVGKKVVKVM